MQIREVDTDVVIEVLADFVVPVQGEVDTGIQNLSVVACQQLSAHRELGRNHGVVGQAVVPVDVGIQAVLQRAEVDAHVGFVHYFPTQPAEVGGVDESVDGGIGAEYGLYVLYACETCTGGNLVVTQLTPAGTQLHVVEDVLVLHERFLRDDPCGTDGGEVAPFVVVLGRAVGTESEHQHVLVVVVIVQPGEIGEAAVFPAVVFHRSAFLVAQCDVFPYVCTFGYVGGSTFEQAVLLLAHGSAQHAGKGVLAPLVGVGGNVVPYPFVVVGVLLGEFGNLFLLVGAYIVGRGELGTANHRVVVAVAAAYVQLVGDEVELCIEVAQHLVGLVPVVVIVGSGYGVVEVVGQAHLLG